MVPIEIRSEASASLSLKPSATSTWLGLGTPALQAEPADALMPSVSSKSKSASLSVPGKVALTIPGSAVSETEFIETSGTHSFSPAMK